MEDARHLLGCPYLISRCRNFKTISAPNSGSLQMQSWRQQIMDQVLRSLPSTTETWTEFQAPDFGLAQLHLLWLFQEEAMN